MIRLVHPTGSPFARNAALALSELGLQAEIVTCFAHSKQSNFVRLLSILLPRIRRELERRTWPAPKNSVIIERRLRETVRVILTRSGISRKLGLPEQKMVDWIYRDLDRFSSHRNWSGIRGVYAYEDGAELLFKSAKNTGAKCFYDLPIVYYQEARRIQEEEASLRPDVAASLAARLDDEEKLLRKDREIALADHIIVPSHNVKRSLCLSAANLDKVHIIPFGAPTDYFKPSVTRNSKFRALFVGQVGPRKGVHYLLDAWRRLKLPNAELHLVGFNAFQNGWLERNIGNAHYHKSIPHTELGAIYQQAEVFVFPSLVEGLALVQLEAMACGLPLITTVNAGGDDLIEDKKEGFLVPIRNVDELMVKILWAYENREASREMGGAARKKAESLSWHRYRIGLQNVFKSALSVEE
jgi:starch synthase